MSGLVAHATPDRRLRRNGIFKRVVSLKEIEYLILEKTYLTGEKKGITEKENMDIIKYLSDLPDQ